MHMNQLHKLKLIDEDCQTSQGKPAYRCVVEAPRGAQTKFKYDTKIGAFVMGHALVKGLSYPYDWGFLPSTCGADGDPLDVMVFHDATSITGMVIPIQVIGVLAVLQEEKGKPPERNDRFFAVPVKSHREDEINHVNQLSKRLRTELEEFFLATANLDDKKLTMLGWRGPRKARALIEEGVRAFSSK
jgi:inorganic pyrophosphatase